jgi:hypothetical protein
MKLPKHTERSRQVLERLAGWGFPPEVAQRLGALTVLWGVFEGHLEKALWSLRGEDVAGKRPWTDTQTIGVWINELGRPRPQLSTEAAELLHAASLAAADLMEYRHSIAHGWMLPSSTMPTFIRNPRWNMEQRKRPTHDAHVDENLLDMALDCAWTLCRVAAAVPSHAENPDELSNIRDDVRRARSLANELRHLTAMVNSEKY